MDFKQLFKKFSWYKPDWACTSMSKETNELLKQCVDAPHVALSDDVDEVIGRSKAFPIPFPIETVRLENLKTLRPIDRLKKNIVSTYPLLHERLLLLMTHFIIYKRQFGISIEKELYKEMGVPQLIGRLLKKRAVAFLGPRDRYLLLSGEEGCNGWESVGTPQEKSPLVLANCLSYDEMKLSAMLFVSGPTECINDGARRNQGVVNEDEIETNAIIIGAIGTRLKRPNRMECEDILITKEQNTIANGYGEDSTNPCHELLKTAQTRANESAKRMWRQMWAEFYQTPSHIFEEVSPQVSSHDSSPEQLYTERYVSLTARKYIFDNEVFYKRISILAESVLLEADARASHVGRDAFLNVIGCGLGVWCVSNHQPDVYVLAFMERTLHLLQRDMLQHVSDINFAYIAVTPSVLEMFTESDGEAGEERIFFENERHPRGGINVQLCNREPSSRLRGPHEGKLLVMTYPWDSNAHPGNEFWFGHLTGSGDPAAACSTQVSELHNAHVNDHVSAQNARVAAPSAGGLRTLPDYCKDSRT